MHPAVQEMITRAVEAERRRAASTPDIVGVAEAAQILGVSKQRVHQLAATATFPDLLTRLKATPVWRRADVEAFQKAREAVSM
jgi:predicted DNA-binding transcriptional regulator AlpA